MTTPRELTPLAFIQNALGQAKFKKTVTLTQIAQIMKSWKSLVRMHDKGLFIVVIAELLNYQFQMFAGRMRAFYNEVYPPVKVIRKKRDGQQSRAIRRRKKIDQSINVRAQQIDLQEEANKVLSNASSQQQQQVRLQQVQKPKSQNSAGNGQMIPKEGEIQVDFQRELDQLDQEEGINNMQEGIVLDENTNTVTNSSSSSNSTANLIPNLEEKLRILGGGDVSFEGKRTVARRRNGAAGATVRRRHQKIDTEIQLLKTQALDLTQIPQRILQQKRRAFDLKKQSQDFQIELSNLTTGIKEKLFSTQNLRRLKNFHKSEKQGGQFFNPETEPTIDFSISQSHIQTSFTLNPSAFSNNINEQSDFNKITMEHFDSNIFRDEKTTTLKKLKQRTGRPKEQIFMKALWMAQRGQVKINQQNPQSFGEISIILLSR